VAHSQDVSRICNKFNGTGPHCFFVWFKLTISFIGLILLPIVVRITIASRSVKAEYGREQ
jgi:heme exporter protein D